MTHRTMNERSTSELRPAPTVDQDRIIGWDHYGTVSYSLQPIPGSIACTLYMLLVVVFFCGVLGGFWSPNSSGKNRHDLKIF